MRTHCGGHIVAHDVSWASKWGNICCGQKMFLKEVRNIFFSNTDFVSSTNVAHAGKRGNICIRHNVSGTLSSFATTLT